MGKVWFFAVLAGIALSSGGSISGQSAYQPADEEELLKTHDYAKARSRVEQGARAGDALSEFSLGYVMVLWLMDPKAQTPPDFPVTEAYAWIKRAALMRSS